MLNVLTSFVLKEDICFCAW